MKLEKYYRNKDKKIETWLRLIYISLSVMILVSCTVTPVIPDRDIISFDGSSQNAGFLYFLPDGSGIITTNAASRYNGLISKYSTNFIPPLVLNYGLTYTNIQTTNYYIISAEGLVKFGLMQHWKRNQIVP